MTAKRMTCRSIAEHVCGELDERVDSPACRAIKRHLTTCPNCRAYLDSLKKTVTLYKNSPVPSLPAERRKELFSILKLSVKRTAKPRRK